MTRKEKRYRKVLKDLNGLSILYTDKDNNTWKCVILAAPGKGLSVKSLASPKSIRKKAGSKIIENWRYPPEHSKFCHFTSTPAGIKNNLEMYEEIIKEKRLNENNMKIGGGGASCRF